MKKNLEFTIDRNFIAFKDTLSVKEAIRRIRKSAKEDTIFYVYVVDERRLLIGVVSIRSLLISSPNKRLKDIMTTRLNVVNEKMEDEEISELFLKTKLLALPVVDDAYRLIGTMTLKEAINVVRMENVEDVLKIQGTNINAFDKSPMKRIQSKLPWLIMTIINGLICGFILKYYEVALKDLIALVFFVPLIQAMGESVSGQSSAIALEGLLLGKIKNKTMHILIIKQIFEAIVIGVIFFILIWLICYLWLKSFMVANIVGITIIFSILFATIVGIFTPFFLKKINIDPVISSNPLVFAVSDISVLVFYFSLSIWFVQNYK